MFSHLKRLQLLPFRKTFRTLLVGGEWDGSFVAKMPMETNTFECAFHATIPLMVRVGCLLRLAASAMTRLWVQEQLKDISARGLQLHIAKT